MSIPFASRVFSDRKPAWGIVIIGATAFVVFVAILAGLYAFEQRRVRNTVIETELPQYTRQIDVYFDHVFEPTRKGLRILAALDTWEDILARGVEDFDHVRRLTDTWAEILDVPDVTVVDLRRDIIYPFWASEPIYLSKEDERDEWYFSTWKRESPPEQKITFYYDEEIGGHALYYDQLIRDDAGEPLGLVGGLHPVTTAVQHVQTVLGPGDAIYLLGDNETPILKITSGGFRYFTDVFGTEGRVSVPDAVDQELIRGAPTTENSVVRSTVDLPIDGMSALIVTSIDARLGPVSRALKLQFFVILSAFAVLIGGYLFIVRIYTRRTIAQLETIRRQRDAIEDLLSIMTHNLGNDLHSLRQQLAAPDNMPDRRRLPSGESVEMTIADMEQAIQNTVYSTRLTDRTVRVKRVAVDPGALLDRLLATFRPVAAGKDQDLVIIRGTNRTIRTDEDILFHILLNLLTNAGKFSAPGTRVLLGVMGTEVRVMGTEEAAGTVGETVMGTEEAARTAGTAGTAGTEDVVSFFVADQGPGFPIEDRNNLFTRHGRLSAQPTMGERSSGVGLYVSRRLADMNGTVLRLRDGLPVREEFGPYRHAFTGAVWEVSVPVGSGCEP